MQFAVALIEYLISGIAASAWISLILLGYLDIQIEKINNYKEIIIALYLPFSYILGIYIDTTSSFIIGRTTDTDKYLTKKYKPYKVLRKLLSVSYKLISGTPSPNSYERSAQILAESIPDAIRTMESYVSRDRIARGAALNSLAGAISTLFYMPDPYKTPTFVVCTIMFIYSLLMYKRLKRLSSKFKEVALSKIKNTKRKRIQAPSQAK